MRRSTHRHIFFTLAVVSIATRAHAQSSMGSVKGTVTDSLRGRPLEGATVVATPLGVRPHSEFLAGLTDARGRFHIKDVPPGRYTVAVEHPLIDSTGIGVPAAEVDVTGARATTVALAIPSALRLRRSLCPVAPNDSLVGVMLGTVRRVDGSTIPGATVIFVWGDFDIDRATASVTPKSLMGSVITDSVGVFRACGLPVARPLTIQAQAGTNQQSGVLEEEIGEMGVRVLNLRIGSTGSPATREPATSDATTTTSYDSATSLGQYLLTGRVQDQSGRPIGSAHVRLFGTTLQATTSQTGAFRLAGLPDGTQGLEVMALGYAPRRINVDVGANGSPITVALERASVVLDSILVTATRISRPLTQANRDFDERARRGPNYYFTAEDIARQRPFYTSDLLRRVPGIRVVRRGFDVFIYSGRGTTTPQFGGGPCPLAMFLNGMPVHPGDIADLPPQFLYGVEVVRSSIGSPPGYMVGTCGAVFVWTK